MSMACRSSAINSFLSAMLYPLTVSENRLGITFSQFLTATFPSSNKLGSSWRRPSPVVPLDYAPSCTSTEILDILDSLFSKEHWPTMVVGIHELFFDAIFWCWRRIEREENVFGIEHSAECWC
jgi:hypothetical protein